MQLWLQFGYGMMEHSRLLLSKWGGGGVVLSPRDLSPKQLKSLAKSLGTIPQSTVLVDPQFYLPHADHERLRSHAYWPADYQTGVFWEGDACHRLMQELADLHKDLGTAAVVLPGVLGERVDDDWIAAHSQIGEEADASLRGVPTIRTLALSGDALRQQDQVEQLIDAIEMWPAMDTYFVAQHPGDRYLVDNPAWLANVLDVCAALKLRGGKVILGYANQQSLLFASAKTDVICSGTWMNVRSFMPEKFWLANEEEIRQRATWYYAPSVLSEYKLPFMDIAFSIGLLPRMRAPAELSDFIDGLFDGAQPSTVGYTEQMAFRHFLHCLRDQALSASATTFDATVALHRTLLASARANLDVLASRGIRGQNRDFGAVLDAQEAALSWLEEARGPVLRRAWSAL